MLMSRVAQSAPAGAGAPCLLFTPSSPGQGQWARACVSTNSLLRSFFGCFRELSVGPLHLQPPSQPRAPSRRIRGRRSSGPSPLLCHTNDHVGGFSSLGALSCVCVTDYPFRLLLPEVLSFLWVIILVIIFATSLGH